MKVRSLLTGKEFEVKDPFEPEQVIAELRIELATMRAKYEAGEVARAAAEARLTAAEAALAVERAKPTPGPLEYPAPQFNVPPAPPAQVIVREGAAHAGFRCNRHQARRRGAGLSSVDLAEARSKLK